RRCVANLSVGAVGYMGDTWTNRTARSAFFSSSDANPSGADRSRSERGSLSACLGKLRPRYHWFPYWYDGWSCLWPINGPVPLGTLCNRSTSFLDLSDTQDRSASFGYAGIRYRRDVTYCHRRS